MLPRIVLPTLTYTSRSHEETEVYHIAKFQFNTKIQIQEKRKQNSQKRKLKFFIFFSSFMKWKCITSTIGKNILKRGVLYFYVNHETFWNAMERTRTFQLLTYKNNNSKKRSIAIQSVLERTRAFFFIVFLWNVPTNFYLKSFVMTHFGKTLINLIVAKSILARTYFGECAKHLILARNNFSGFSIFSPE